jgi:hypothetical protein
LSKILRDIYQRKLTKLLSRTPTEQFFVLAWATNAIQSGRSHEAAGLISYPVAAATNDLTSPYAIFPWHIETLLNELLKTPKANLNKSGPNRVLDCSKFKSIHSLKKALVELENASSKISLERIDVRLEMHRIAQRTFGWQTGFHDEPSYYRSAFIYSGHKTKEHFQTKRGLSLDNFVLGCFTLMALFLNKPYVNANIDGSSIGLDRDSIKSLMNTISISQKYAENLSRRIRGNSNNISYRKSIFVEYPVVSFGANEERLLCALPELLALRCTSGLFYDVVDANASIKNEISKRFEQYSKTLLHSVLRSGVLDSDFPYYYKKNQFRSSDIVYRTGRVVNLVIECKATKLSYDARFSEHPIEDARRHYQEIAKGVFQVWRFVSHCRLQQIPRYELSEKVVGVVLTLDTWLTASVELQRKVIEHAKEISAKKSPEIENCDQIPIMFCSIEELEMTLHRADENSLLTALFKSTEDKYKGWALSSVHQVECPDTHLQNPYPFEGMLRDFFPWWLER